MISASEWRWQGNLAIQNAPWSSRLISASWLPPLQTSSPPTLLPLVPGENHRVHPLEGKVTFKSPGHIPRIFEGLFWESASVEDGTCPAPGAPDPTPTSRHQHTFPMPVRVRRNPQLERHSGREEGQGGLPRPRHAGAPGTRELGLPWWSAAREGAGKKLEAEGGVLPVSPRWVAGETKPKSRRFGFTSGRKDSGDPL